VKFSFSFLFIFLFFFFPFFFFLFSFFFLAENHKKSKRRRKEDLTTGSAATCTSAISSVLELWRGKVDGAKEQKNGKENGKMEEKCQRKIFRVHGRLSAQVGSWRFFLFFFFSFSFLHQISFFSIQKRKSCLTNKL